MSYLEPRGGPNSLPVAHPGGSSSVAIFKRRPSTSRRSKFLVHPGLERKQHARSVALVPTQIVIGAAIGMTSNPLHGPSQWRHPDTPSPSLAQSLLDSALLSFFTNTSIKLEISTPSAGVRFPRGPPFRLPRAPPPRRPGVQSRACPQKHTDHAAPARSYRG